MQLEPDDRARCRSLAETIIIMPSVGEQHQHGNSKRCMPSRSLKSSESRMRDARRRAATRQLHEGARSRRRRSGRRSARALRLAEHQHGGEQQRADAGHGDRERSVVPLRDHADHQDDERRRRRATSSGRARVQVIGLHPGQARRRRSARLVPLHQAVDRGFEEGEEGLRIDAHPQASGRSAARRPRTLARLRSSSSCRSSRVILPKMTRR